MAEEKQTDKYDFTMVAYELENTLTENGHVARGVCAEDENHYLTAVTERTRIEKYDGGIHFTTDDGATWTDLPEHTPVSMNMWGYTSSFLKEVEERFPKFLKETVPANPAKAEFFLPMTVGEMLKEGKATVKGLRTPDKWYGVTYAADKPQVVEALRAMTQEGKYPDGLWG